VQEGRVEAVVVRREGEVHQEVVVGHLDGEDLVVDSVAVEAVAAVVVASQVAEEVHQEAAGGATRYAAGAWVMRV
jgi:hypothetical protein